MKKKKTIELSLEAKICESAKPLALALTEDLRSRKVTVGVALASLLVAIMDISLEQKYFPIQVSGFLIDGIYEYKKRFYKALEDE